MGVLEYGKTLVLKSREMINNCQGTGRRSSTRIMVGWSPTHLYPEVYPPHRSLDWSLPVDRYNDGGVLAVLGCPSLLLCDLLLLSVDECLSFLELEEDFSSLCGELSEFSLLSLLWLWLSLLRDEWWWWLRCRSLSLSRCFDFFSAINNILTVCMLEQE